MTLIYQTHVKTFRDSSKTQLLHLKNSQVSGRRWKYKWETHFDTRNANTEVQYEQRGVGSSPGVGQTVRLCVFKEQQTQYNGPHSDTM